MTIRKVKWTILAVGEGDAEVAFLEHLKEAYFDRACGATMKIHQAYGKGAGNVVQHAIHYAAGRDYSRRVAVFDTDQDYTPEVIELARLHRLVTVPSAPCLEALMLRLSGDTRERSSEQHKREFERRFGGRVQDRNLLARYFPLPELERARDIEPLLHRLINSFGIPRKLARRQCIDASPGDIA